jgi:uncharacterized damage-inducible protein DinB
MNCNDIILNGHQTVLHAIDELAEAEWHTPGVCGAWSVKDILAHLASFELVLVDVLRSLHTGGPAPHLDRLLALDEHFNDAEVLARKDHTPQTILEEYITAYREADALLEQIPTATRRQPGTLPWYGEAYALDDLLVYMYYGHKREHCAEIAVFRDQLARSL